MRNFTKMFLSVLCCAAGVLTVQAQDEVIDLTADMFYTWDGDGANASSIAVATVDFKVGEEVNAGTTIAGTGSVLYLTYADLTGSTKMLFEGTAGVQLRVLLNRQGSDSGPLVEKNPVIGDDGTAELDLTDLDFLHLNAIKFGWGSPTGTVTAIKLVKPADPLAIDKEQLKAVISLAKMQSPVAKTEDSFAALQQAIADAEAALAAAASAESLQQAKANLENAIAGLTLAEGYSNLTKEMFLQYASVEEPGEGTAANSAYELFVASNLPYGDGNVGELLWADLTQFDKLVVSTVGTIKPRFCLNRLVAGGQQAATMEESKMLDINPNNDFLWSTEKYLTVEDGVYTLDLKKIVADYGFARLHCIKKQGWGDGVVVTGMYLCKEPAVEPFVPAYGVIWTGNESFGNLGGNFALATKLFKGLAKKNDIIRVSAAAVAEARGEKPLRNVKENSSVTLWAGLEDSAPFSEWTMEGQLDEAKTLDFMIDEDALALIIAEEREFIYVKGVNVSISQVELVEGVIDGISQVKNVKAADTIYNLNGQQVVKATKGLYIIGGKKVLVK